MTRQLTRHSLAKLLVMTAALAGVDQAAVAQAPDAGAQKEIVVEAPRAVPAPVERSPYSGAPIVVTTVKISALYGDLDLNTPRDAARLMVRIKRVAQDACKYLDRIHPFSSDETCVDKAVAGATPSAQAAIAAAGQ